MTKEKLLMIKRIFEDFVNKMKILKFWPVEKIEQNTLNSLRQGVTPPAFEKLYSGCFVIWGVEDRSVGGSFFNLYGCLGSLFWLILSLGGSFFDHFGALGGLFWWIWSLGSPWADFGAPRSLLEVSGGCYPYASGAFLMENVGPRVDFWIPGKSEIAPKPHFWG